MSMTTKCPSCGTTFRVTPQQLQAQRGRVRCGRCAAVFDGFKALATLRDESTLDAAPAAVRNEREPVEAPPHQLVGDQHAPVFDAPGAAPQPEAVAPPSLPSVISAPETPPPPPAAVSAALAPVPQAVIPEAVAPAAVEAEPAAPATPPMQKTELVMPPPAVVMPDPAPLVLSEPAAPMPVQPVAASESPPASFVSPFDVEPLPRRRSGAWAFGILLLVIALAAQGIYFYRGEIAARVPEARPYLNKMCEYFRCTVALPQNPRQISIEASDMQATDPANPGQIALTATLRNQATNALGFPALDVVLTNVKEHTVARRIFLPADYLDGGRDPRTGIQPNAEVTVRLNLETGDLGAAGFRLDLLAAPAR